MLGTDWHTGDKDGYTPLAIASKGKETLEVLLELGAELEHRDGKGRTAL